MYLRRIEGKGETEAMKYEHMTEGIFLSRPNRFIAMVEAEGSQAKAHVKHTGRCREGVRARNKRRIQEDARNCKFQEPKYFYKSTASRKERQNIP